MEWIVERMKLPREIVEFLVSVFEIYEIRRRVGEQHRIIGTIQFLGNENEKESNFKCSITSGVSLFM